MTVTLQVLWLGPNDPTSMRIADEIDRRGLYCTYDLDARCIEPKLIVSSQHSQRVLEGVQDILCGLDEVEALLGLRPF